MGFNSAFKGLKATEGKLGKKTVKGKTNSKV